MERDLQEIFVPLVKWYEMNKRDLPWRRTKNPYEIWVSEIMLQQTRVEAVKPYYERFLTALPTVQSLAEAEEEMILKLWEGLGYYSRVRNMQAAAKQIMMDYGGVLPRDYKKLRSLKGIGDYTAGAIASIAFSLPCAAVDGNVLRVLSRIYMDEQDISLTATKKYWKEEIEAALTSENASSVNEGLMELGAVICTPNGQPRCQICPLREFCGAYRFERIPLFPVKAVKKQKTVEYLQVFFLTDGKNVALRKRGSGLLANLWELPNENQDVPIPSLLKEWGILEGEIIPMKSQKHIFTHIEWKMDGYFVLVKKMEDTPFRWLKPENITKDFAIPSAFKKIWDEGNEKRKKFC